MVTVGELVAKLSEVEDQSMPVMIGGIGADIEVFLAGHTEDYTSAVILSAPVMPLPATTRRGAGSGQPDNERRIRRLVEAKGGNEPRSHKWKGRT